MLFSQQRIVAIISAEQIASSGRWLAINNSILEANRISPQNWRIEVFASLVAQLFSDYLELKAAFKADSSQISLLAWRARNLVETSVWLIYSAKDDNHARTFYEDAGRDGIDLIKAISNWGHSSGQSSEWLDIFPAAIERLNTSAKERNIDSLEGSYTQVRNAAHSINMEKEFNVCWKILSKFAHPTAYSIINPHANDDEKTLFIKEFSYECGCTYFLHAFDFAESKITALLEQIR